MNLVMEKKDYEFIHEDKPDGSERKLKKIQRFILIILSGCVLVELAAAVILLYLSYNIKKDMQASSQGREEILQNRHNINDEQLESMINEAIDENMAGLSDYKDLYSRLKLVSQAAGRYIVTISGIDISKEWPGEHDRAATGIIIKKSSEVIIISDLSSIDTDSGLEVTFYTGDSCTGQLIAMDDILGIGAVRVLREDMDTSVYKGVETAHFGKSSDITVGEDIIVMGSPYGTDGYVAYGNLTSATDDVKMVDGECHLLTTDINTTENMNGFVINLEGSVIGIVNNTFKKKSMEEIVAAILIADIEDTINTISEGRERAYLGIEGEDVTDRVIEIVDENMPFGVYVKDTVPDSPAYNAGILSGDIIVGINGEDIRSMYDIMKTLNSCQGGSYISVDVMRKGRDEYKSIEYKITV